MLNRLGPAFARCPQTLSFSTDQALFQSAFSKSEIEDFVGELEIVVSQITSGVQVTQEEMLPLLCRERVQDRIAVNFGLAKAFASVGDLANATTTISRAWRLSGGSTGLFPLYKTICLAQNDIASIRQAYKRMGMVAAKRNDLDHAMEFFDLWQNAFNTFESQDRFEYDFDILDCIENFAAPYRTVVSQDTRSKLSHRLRIGYLLKWVCEVNSNLMTISHAFADFHNQSKFEVIFFVSDLVSDVAASPSGTAHVELLRKKGYKVVVNSTPYPESLSKAKSMISFSNQILAENLDILVTCAGLSDFSHAFITALRPARFVIGHVQGPPPQFVHPLMDWCISWSKHPLIDSPANCSLVELQMTGKTAQEGQSYSKEQMDLPENSCVLISGGRFTKFQSRIYWECINEILEQFGNVIYVVSGVEEGQIPFFPQALSEHTRDRVRFLGWRADFEQILGAADVLVDTFPNGGGQVIVQAMARGIPVVAHQNNYLNEFCQTNWSPVEDFLHDKDLVVPRGDFRAVKAILARLITDSSYRRIKGEDCRAQIANVSPEPAVRACEQIYADVAEGLKFRA